MILTLFGSDTFRSKRKLAEIKAKFLRDIDSSGMNLTELEGNEDVSVLRGAISAAPFLAKKRMVIAKGLFSSVKKKDRREKDLEEILSAVPEETILVLFEDTDGEKLVKSGLFKQFKNNQFYPEFVPLPSSRLAEWIAAEAAERNIAFAPDALKEYLRFATPDLWKLSGDLDKFAAYLHGKDRALAIEDLHNLAELKVESGLFEFLDAVGTKRTGLAARLLNDLLNQGENEVALLNRIQSHVRALLVSADKAGFGAVSKDELARELGVHPYVASKAMMQARYFSLEELKGLYAWTIEADQRLKTGGWSKPRMAVELFLVQMEAKA